MANGRLERPNNRWLWRPTAGLNALTTKPRGQSAWSKLPRSIWRLAKRQAWTPWQQMAMECLVEAAAERCRGLKASRQKQVPHLRWSQASPLPWRRQGSADICIWYYMIYIYISRYIYIYMFLNIINENITNTAMDQNLISNIFRGWTSIYKQFSCLPGYMLLPICPRWQLYSQLLKVSLGHFTLGLALGGPCQLLLDSMQLAFN